VSAEPRIAAVGRFAARSVVIQDQEIVGEIGVSRAIGIQGLEGQIIVLDLKAHVADATSPPFGLSTAQQQGAGERLDSLFINNLYFSPHRA
jgi:hypothetical protein